MTRVLQHAPYADEVSPGVWRPKCGCGWRGKQPQIRQEVAQKVAEQHAAFKGCGKKRFASKAEADQVILDAKIARNLEGRRRRREERSYLCQDCPGGTWHVSSKPTFAERR